MKHKLLSVNVEGNRHVDNVLLLLDEHDFDIICLQEAAGLYIDLLKSRGYRITTLERVKKETPEGSFTDHMLIATKTEHVGNTWYYYNPSEELLVESTENRRNTNRQGLVEVIFTDSDGDTYTILTTHFTWTHDGKTVTDTQREDMKKLLNYTGELPPHIITGDFNLARNSHELYPKLLEHYVDNIPPEYKSSMDKEHHWRGPDPTRAVMFEEYMVDYIFSQAPYVVSDVRLQFGVSDHAAVIANISKH